MYKLAFIFLFLAFSNAKIVKKDAALEINHAYKKSNDEFQQLKVCLAESKDTLWVLDIIDDDLNFKQIRSGQKIDNRVFKETMAPAITYSKQQELLKAIRDRHPNTKITNPQSNSTATSERKDSAEDMAKYNMEELPHKMFNKVVSKKQGLLKEMGDKHPKPKITNPQSNSTTTSVKKDKAEDIDKYDMKELLHKMVNKVVSKKQGLLKEMRDKHPKPKITNPQSNSTATSEKKDNAEDIDKYDMKELLHKVVNKVVSKQQGLLKEIRDKHPKTKITNLQSNSTTTSVKKDSVENITKYDVKKLLHKMVNKLVLFYQGEPSLHLHPGDNNKISFKLYFKGPYTSLVIRYKNKRWHYFINPPSPLPHWFYEKHEKVTHRGRAMYVQVPDTVKNEFYVKFFYLLNSLLSFAI